MCSAELDLYLSVLQYAASHSFSDDKLSALLGITRAVHQAAIRDGQALTAAYEHLSKLLLVHSVHRPPLSSAVFSLVEMKAISAWLISTYFTHYNLYQYVFVTRHVVSVTSSVPGDAIEVAPATLPPLEEAIDEEAHSKVVAEQDEAAAVIAKAEAVQVWGACGLQATWRVHAYWDRGWGRRVEDGACVAHRYAFCSGAVGCDAWLV